jgi:hypothetical protein
MHTCCTTNTPLFGVLEWISLQGGTFNAFTPGLITGKVRGLTYRYFITEGWIGLKALGCPAGKAIECLTVEDFQCALEIHAPNAKAETSAMTPESGSTSLWQTPNKPPVSTSVHALPPIEKWCGFLIKEGE